jgi:hypothetical protein
MRLLRGTLVLLWLVTLAAAGCQGSTAPQDACVAVDGAQVVTGDGAYPVPLPDGCTAWLFGDSLLRTPNGNVLMVHNTILARSRRTGSSISVHGGSDEYPTDLIPSADPWTVIWPGGGFVEGGSLQVFAEEIRVAGGDFHSTGQRFQVSLSLPDLRVTGRSAVYGGEISWGHAVLVQAGDVYVYGNRELDGWTNVTYLARFALGASHGPWRFWDGHGFQKNPRHAAPLEGPDGDRQVAKLASVIALAEGIAAFTIDPCGATIDTRVAAHPWGPFSAKRSVFTIPERDAYLPRASWVGSNLQIVYSVPDSPPRSVRLPAAVMIP